MEFAVLGLHDGPSELSIACVSLTGEVIALYQTPALCRGELIAQDAVASLVAETRDVLGECSVFLPVEALCLGSAGAEHEDRREVMLAVLGDTGIARDLTVTTDTVVAFAGAHGLRPGVLVTADRGTIVVGGEESETGLTISRADGWGPLLGDEGSAVWIALQSLRAATRDMDDRGPNTLLTERILTTLGVQCPRDLVSRVTLDAEGLAWIMPVFPLCVQAAKDKDAVAMSIIDAAVDSLVRSCAAVLGRLEGASVPVATAGVVFEHDLISSEFERRLGELAPQAALQDPILPPQMGAALMALVRYFPFDDYTYGLEDLIDNLSSSYWELHSIPDDRRSPA